MTAIAATLLSYKTVPTRKVFQFTLEMPIERAAEAIALFGNVDPDGATWLGVARLKPAPEGAIPLQPHSPSPEDKPRTPFREMKRSAQAALKCQDTEFQNWLLSKFDMPGAQINAERADVVLKRLLHITSKRELDSDADSGEAWSQLLASYDYRDRT